MSLLSAWEQNGRTDNGMKTNLSSGNSCLDLFFLAGASRGKDISVPFLRALNENSDLAIRILLWLRDIRGGAGERLTFRKLVVELTKQDVDSAKKIIKLIPEVGRWDDMLSLIGTPVEKEALGAIQIALANGNALCAKWMPRKGKVASYLRVAFGMTPKQYRKTLVNLSKVVETQMCNKEWKGIEYSHVPSVAAARYQAAFSRNDEKRYAEYREALKKGEAKINAGAIFPHDVIKGLNSGTGVADEQWKALPNYMEGSNERILPVCDVSGSMYGLPMEISIALGLYISERNESVFKDVVCTFSRHPQLIKLRTAGLANRVREISQIDWGMNTDLNAVFQNILNVAMQHHVPEREMPSTVLIISDMEFDQCINHDDNAIQMIRRQYKRAGYELPKVVFWNVNGRQGNSPVRTHDTGTALISGFSPAILRSILSANMEEFTPENIMINTIMVDRYNWK